MWLTRIRHERVQTGVTARPRRTLRLGAPVARLAMLVLLLLLRLGATPCVAPAQVPRRDTSSVAHAGATAESPSSPRAAVREFVRLAEAKQYDRAARFLKLSGRDRARAPDLAFRLYEVIDRWILLDLARVSPLADGDPSDGEPPLQDRIGRVMPGAPAVVGQLVLVKQTEPGAVHWVFAPETVANIDAAYAQLGVSWTEGRLPLALRADGPFGFPRWKWLGALGGPPVIWLLACGLAWLIRGSAVLAARRRRAAWTLEFADRTRGPVRLFVAVLLGLPVVHFLELDFSVSAAIWRTLTGTAILALFWGLLVAIRLAEEGFVRRAAATSRTHAHTVVPLLSGAVRITLAAAALLFVIAQFGYPIGTVLAGLGIGGIAVALAAQKTVENMFGSLSLAADRVFRVGDWVQVEGVQGSVESIGLRSTHLRTLDRTLVKIPNGRLADLRIESFGERDRIHLLATLHLAYGTPTAQVRDVIARVEALLHDDARVSRDGIAVRFTALGESSLDVTVNAWILTTDASTFDVARQDLLFAMLDAIAHAGARLATPTRTLVLASGDGRSAAVPDPDVSGTRAW